MSKKEEIKRLGRDAGSILEEGPTYFIEDSKLIWELNNIRQTLDPSKAIAELKAKNKKLAARAEKEADEGSWALMARQKARENLIEAIAKEFNLEDETGNEKDVQDDWQ